MSQILAAAARRLATTGSLGKAALNALFPNDFEYYLCALELVAIKKGNVKETVKYFVFPIMPDAMRESKRTGSVIEKTAGGINVSKYSKFVPRTIFLSGSFGRSFKVLVGEAFSIPNGFTSFKEGVNFFDNTVKTGYGCIKVLEGMIEQSNMTADQNGQEVFYQLVFHNLALGNHYLVEYTDLTFSQDAQSNMIWMYNLQLVAIAPVSALYSIQEQNKLQRKLSASAVLQTVGKSVLSNIKTGLNSLL